MSLHRGPLLSMFECQVEAIRISDICFAELPTSGTNLCNRMVRSFDINVVEFASRWRADVKTKFNVAQMVFSFVLSVLINIALSHCEEADVQTSSLQGFN